MRRNVLRPLASMTVVVLATVLAAACGSSDPSDIAPAEDESAAIAQDTATVEAAPTESPSTEAGSADTEDNAVIDTERFPTVVDVTATASGEESWRFDVTLSSPYDTPERYADAWRVLDADGNELGIRVLTHDHANEQPFTRSTTVEIPPGVDQVFVEGRDQANGWSGERFEVTLAR